MLTYGDVAEYVGTRAARNVGRILAGSGEQDDDLPGIGWCGPTAACAEHIRAEQMQRLRGEGVPLSGIGSTSPSPVGRHPSGAR